MTAELAGIKQFKVCIWKTLKNSRSGILDQVISNPAARTATGACTESGPSIWFFQDHQWKQRHDPSLQAASHKRQAQARLYEATSSKRQASSSQASSDKRQALSNKRQASSRKRQAPRFCYPHKVLEEQGPRAFAKIKVLCGCFTWNAIWCGEKRKFITFGYLQLNSEPGVIIVDSQQIRRT